MGYVIVGVGVGLLGLVAALVAGRGLVAAILAYVAMGAATTMLLPMLTYVLHRAKEAEDEDGLPDFSKDLVTDRAASPVLVTPPLKAEFALPEVVSEAPIRILAVDDDALILELIPKLAMQAGYENVVTVASATEALVLLEQTTTPFRCILLDIQMPGMDGIELCGRIRRMKVHQKTPLMMLTAKSEHSFLERAFKAGATDYLTKPFDVNDFAVRLKTAIETPAAELKEKIKRIVPTKVFGKARATAKTEQRAAADAINAIASGNFIHLNALSNYLTRLSGATLVRSTVVAVQVEHIDDLQKSLPSYRLQRVLEEVASSIDALLGSERYIGAYVGRGQFVLVCSHDAVGNVSNAEADLQYLLDQRLDDESLGLTRSISVLVGATVRPRTSRMNRARDAFGTAIDLVDARTEYATGVVHMPRLRSVPGTTTG